MIYSIDQVRHLHLEISSLCNAACPLCPRNVNGYPYNAGYKEHNMTLEEAKKIFPVAFVKQLNQILVNGNFGDAVMNPDTVPICEYFKEHNPKLHINISTNGGARDAKFWKGLAKIGVEVTFCIDGIDDYTHALYRRNTLYTTVIRNSATFIAAGGHANWKMIKFEHNSTLREEARRISIQRGFKNFSLINDGRDTGPVYNNNGDLVHVIGASKIDWVPPARIESLLDGSFNPIYKSKRIDWVKKEDIKDIHCEVAKSRSVYVSSTGDVFPCCYMGFNPAEFRNNSDQGYSMEQINRIMSKNNALEYDLATCIKWFDQVEDSWGKDSFDGGRLLTCNQVCGGSNLRPQFHVKEAEMYHNPANKSQIPKPASV
jgi:hypothetical protein